MSSLLYYSISRNFDKKQIIEIDKKVSKNRKQIIRVIVIVIFFNTFSLVELEFTSFPEKPSIVKVVKSNNLNFIDSSDEMSNFLLQFRGGGDDLTEEDLQNTVKSITNNNYLYDNVVDKKLQKSVISKTLNSEYSEVSINKILKKVVNVIGQVVTNSRLLQLASYNKEATINIKVQQSQPSILVESFSPKATTLSPMQKKVQIDLQKAKGVTSTMLAMSKDNKLMAYKEIETFDGFQAKISRPSLRHLLSGHGDTFNIDDPLPKPANQKPKKYTRVTTRVNNHNEKIFLDEITAMLQNPKVKVLVDVDARGVNTRVYQDKINERLIAIHTEGDFKDFIMKAQPYSPAQLEILDKLRKID